MTFPNTKEYLDRTVTICENLNDPERIDFEFSSVEQAQVAQRLYDYAQQDLLESMIESFNDVPDDHHIIKTEMVEWMKDYKQVLSRVEWEDLSNEVS